MEDGKDLRTTNMQVLLQHRASADKTPRAQSYFYNVYFAWTQTFTNKPQLPFRPTVTGLWLLVGSVHFKMKQQQIFFSSCGEIVVKLW